MRGSGPVYFRRRRRGLPQSERFCGSHKGKDGSRVLLSLLALLPLWLEPLLLWNVPFLERMSPAGRGRLDRGSTLMSHAAMMIRRLTAASAAFTLPSTFR